MQDKLGASDLVEAGISTTPTPHAFPCPITGCGKATKDNNTDETREAGKNLRICSNRNCRTQTDWTSGSPVVLT